MTASKIVAAAASGAGSDPVGVENVFAVNVRSGTGHGTAWSVDNGIDLSGEGGLVFYGSRSQIQNRIACFYCLISTWAYTITFIKISNSTTCTLLCK